MYGVLLFEFYNNFILKFFLNFFFWYLTIFNLKLDFSSKHQSVWRLYFGFYFKSRSVLSKKTHDAPCLRFLVVITLSV